MLSIPEEPTYPVAFRERHAFFAFELHDTGMHIFPFELLATLSAFPAGEEDAKKLRERAKDPFSTLGLTSSDDEEQPPKPFYVRLLSPIAPTLSVLAEVHAMGWEVRIPAFPPWVGERTTAESAMKLHVESWRPQNGDFLVVKLGDPESMTIPSLDQEKRIQQFFQQELAKREVNVSVLTWWYGLQLEVLRLEKGDIILAKLGDPENGGLVTPEAVDKFDGLLKGAVESLGVEVKTIVWPYNVSLQLQR